MKISPEKWSKVLKWTSLGGMALSAAGLYAVSTSAEAHTELAYVCPAPAYDALPLEDLDRFVDCRKELTYVSDTEKKTGTFVLEVGLLVVLGSTYGMSEAQQLKQQQIEARKVWDIEAMPLSPTQIDRQFQSIVAEFDKPDTE